MKIDAKKGVKIPLNDIFPEELMETAPASGIFE